ncbi:hypothetical protein [Bacillus atrophaeus]|uniref:hypothetical protein n=1 Tax=Bacillus atrophaeus TaxID=1452 RepID=UPI002E24CD42|nr:hypothetical protein [Bacillus atrophaeus]
MYDKDDLKQQVVLRFSDITQKRVQKETEAESEGKTDPSSESNNSKLEMQTKIATAKLHANKEMETFRKATEQYMKDIEGLVLFEGIGSIVEDLMLDQLLRNIISPAIKGQQIPGMPEEQYRKFRTDMYKALIDTYVDKN